MATVTGAPAEFKPRMRRLRIPTASSHLPSEIFTQAEYTNTVGVALDYEGDYRYGAMNRLRPMLKF